MKRKYLIRREWRSGASWYELTHDRLIKPIIDSNKKWKNENERKKKNKILKSNTCLTVPAIVVSVILFIYVFIRLILYLSQQRIYKLSGIHHRISVNPSTNIVYVTNMGDNTVSVIDGKTNSVITNIKVGNSPNGVSVNPIN